MVAYLLEEDGYGAFPGEAVREVMYEYGDELFEGVA
jgi:hypothetical protein